MSDLEIRRATPADETEVLELFRIALGWKTGDPNEELFAWKHKTNPFGPSPAWVATDNGRIVGYRTFLRWQFLDGHNKPVRAVRAVDTVTSPEYQGRGIFRRLTLQAVAELTLAGDRIVFNTPNDQSRPGYLKMGWTIARHLPVGLLPAGVRGVRRMLASRVPAELWSEPTDAGLAPEDVWNRPGAAEALLPELREAAERANEDPFLLRDFDLQEIATGTASGSLTLVDLRPDPEFRAGHLPGAISRPFGILAETDLSDLATANPVVGYCRGPWCLKARQGVDLLNHKGIPAKRLRAGVVEWQAAGLPLEH